MRIGIVCYASTGGSGIVATELAVSLAARGHEVHVLSTEPPFRFPEGQPGLFFHPVETPSYPLFREPQYALSLATAIVQVSRRHHLDIVHAHYAVPHAAAAYLARQIMAAHPTDRVPRVMTTLHGTDITLVGSDPSYSETVAFCIDQSDAVTAVSRSLKEDTCRALGITRPIDVIPNFLDVERFARRPGPPPAGPPRIVHMSNFRPVKRIDAVVDVFARVRAARPARLVLVGDGPELPGAQARLRQLGLDADVEIAGERLDVVDVLSGAAVFLLPSATESFGLAALEAMACEVPVVASRVGGLPEVIDDGEAGFLHAPEDIEGMAHSVGRLLDDEELRQRMGTAGRWIAVERFSTEKIVPQYEEAYGRLDRG
ncbi:MAG TPA: N-acetyl-alpha-D-glucosaminyl L-malate synthase BshA [Vicinamibacterales bacterium]